MDLIVEVAGQPRRFRTRPTATSSTLHNLDNMSLHDGGTTGFLKEILADSLKARRLLNFEVALQDSKCQPISAVPRGQQFRIQIPPDIPELLAAHVRQ